MRHKCRRHGPSPDGHFYVNAGVWRCREGLLESRKRYDATERGMARYVRYNFTEKGRGRFARYQLSEKGSSRFMKRSILA